MKNFSTQNKKICFTWFKEKRKKERKENIREGKKKKEETKAKRIDYVHRKFFL